jgi:hypothetical protein
MAQPTFDFLESLNIDQDVTSRLSQSLTRIVDGNLDVYRTPWAKEYSIPDMLLAWQHATRTAIPLDTKLQELESANLKKCGPRSLIKPWAERKVQLDTSYADNPKASAWESTIPELLDMEGLRPAAMKAALLKLKNSTSSGLPFMKRKSIVKKRVAEDHQYYLDRNDPCVLFTRSEGGEPASGGKTRDVWGYPIAWVLEEMKYFIPYLQYEKQLPWRSALNGPEATDIRMTHLFSHAKATGGTLVAVDFSSYDANLKGRVLEHAWKIVRGAFQHQLSERMDGIIKKFSHTGLVTPDGVRTGIHGVPSGSVWTNTLDSRAQYEVGRACPDVSHENCDCQGDDGDYSVLRPDMLYREFERAGFILNQDKVHESQNYTVYLQNYYSRTYQEGGILRGVYPAGRALLHIAFQSQWSKFEDYDMEGASYYALRAIQILEACKHHPWFPILVKFVRDRDKYRLEYTHEDVRKYQAWLADVKGVGQQFEHQYGSNLSKLGEFKTVRLLRSLA